jgi:hypothetical protein
MTNNWVKQMKKGEAIDKTKVNCQSWDLDEGWLQSFIMSIICCK